MTKLKNLTAMTIDHEDVARILTEELCTYNALADLMVESVNQNNVGSFDLNLVPKPAKPKKEAE